MKMIIVRHGETIANKKNIVAGLYNTNLSQNGLIQAKKLAKYLAKYQIDKIYSSKLKRAIKTAEEITKFHKNIPYEKIYEMHERALGDLEGVRGSEFILNPLPRGYETDIEIIKRTKTFLKKIFVENRNSTILLVAHSEFNKALLSIILGFNKYSRSFSQDNCCINIVEINSSKKSRLKLMNYTKHLED